MVLVICCIWYGRNTIKEKSYLMWYCVSCVVSGNCDSSNFSTTCKGINVIVIITAISIYSTEIYAIELVCEFETNLRF